MGFIRRLFVPCLLGCLLGVMPLADVRAAGEWTRFRGPDGTGIVDAPAIPSTFSEADYRWNVELPGRGHSSPVLWGKKIFLTCEVREKKERSVVCLDSGDGRLLWSSTSPFEELQINKLNSHAASTPAVDADGVYVSWISGTTFIVLALDHDGKPLWERKLGDFKSVHGPGASPIVMDGIVIMGNDHAGEGAFLIGLDSKTGEIRWKRPRKSDKASYVTPAVYRPKEGPVELIYASPAHGFTGIDPQSGEVTWELGGLFAQKTAASPTLAGEVVFATGGSGGRGVESAAVRRGDGPSGRRPEVAYTVDAALPYVPTPIVFGSQMFVWADNGIVTCVDTSDGRKVWQQRVGGEYFGSPVCISGRLFNVSKQGEVVVLAASTKYELLGRSQLPEGSYATPAVAGGCVYFRTFSRLICVAGK
jgi:outer membrane protein assembly factor BamB